MAWAIAYPEIAHQMMRLLARHGAVMTSCAVEFAFADPAGRLARRILLLGKRFGSKQGDVVRVKHDLTLQEFSQFAGVEPGSIRATLRDFENRGWIRLADNCLEIVDAQSLAALPGGR
jgi:CRP/FNR family cyclic AMP-dependent transcriptional regulator